MSEVLSLEKSPVLKRFNFATGLKTEETNRFFGSLAEAFKGGLLAETDLIQAIREWGRINQIAGDNACVGGSNACV